MVADATPYTPHHTFTDQTTDPTGLLSFGARYYDGEVGRFLSPDPALLDGRLVRFLPDPQQLNGYAYARNNPCVYVDPGGESLVAALILGGAILYGVFADDIPTANAPSPTSNLVSASDTENIFEATIPAYDALPESAKTVVEIGMPVVVGSTAASASKLIKQQAVRGVAGDVLEGQVIRETAQGFRSFTKNNFRDNLAQLTGGIPRNAQAHHVFPQKFENKFAQQINIHNPHYGAWWNTTGHQKNANVYNNAWTGFFKDYSNPTRRQILNKGRELAKEYGFQINY